MRLNGTGPRPFQTTGQIPGPAPVPAPPIPVVTRGTPAFPAYSSGHVSRPVSAQNRNASKQAGSRGYIPPVDAYRSQSTPRLPATADAIPAQQPSYYGSGAGVLSSSGQARYEVPAPDTSGNSREAFVPGGLVNTTNPAYSVPPQLEVSSGARPTAQLQMHQIHSAASTDNGSGGGSNDLLYLQQIEQLRSERAAQESRLALLRDNEQQLNTRIDELSDSLAMAAYEARVLYAGSREGSDRTTMRLQSDLEFHVSAAG